MPKSRHDKRDERHSALTPTEKHDDHERDEQQRTRDLELREQPAEKILRQRLRPAGCE